MKLVNGVFAFQGVLAQLCVCGHAGHPGTSVPRSLQEPQGGAQGRRQDVTDGGPGHGVLPYPA